MYGLIGLTIGKDLVKHTAAAKIIITTKAIKVIIVSKTDKIYYFRSEVYTQRKNRWLWGGGEINKLIKIKINK